ncbi:MAG: murein hydrolase activator EnvC [Tenuifilaceae bacterium]
MKIARTLNIFLLVLVFLLATQNSYSQTVNELKNKKVEIEKEISSINNLIVKTEKETKTSISNIQLTKRKIDLKQQYIKQLEEEEGIIQEKINSKKHNIDSLRRLSEAIKLEYAKVIIYSQKNKEKSNVLLLVFSSKDFNQAYKRLKFFQQLLKYKSQQVIKYKIVISNLKSESDLLNENVQELSRNQKEKTNEINNLRNVQNTYKQKVEKLSKKKKELLAELEKQKSVSLKLNNEIKRLIEEETRKARENVSTRKNVNLTALSANFRENVGKLSLPVEKGIITGVYGEAFHPVLKDVKVKNNGIDITVSEKSYVYSVFKGEVRKIFKVPGSNLAVIVRHGNYLTVYSNLTTVNVNAGQDLQAFEKIGEISIPRGENSNILHFELWNENKTEDPLKWIKVR